MACGITYTGFRFIFCMFALKTLPSRRSCRYIYPLTKVLSELKIGFYRETRTALPLSFCFSYFSTWVEYQKKLKFIISNSATLCYKRNVCWVCIQNKIQMSIEHICTYVSPTNSKTRIHRKYVSMLPLPHYNVNVWV